MPRRVRINASRSPRTFGGVCGCGRTRVLPSALALRALVARCVTKGRGAGKYLKIDFPRQNRETFTSRRALIGGERKLARETACLARNWRLRIELGVRWCFLHVCSYKQLPSRKLKTTRFSLAHLPSRSAISCTLRNIFSAHLLCGVSVHCDDRPIPRKIGGCEKI